MKNGNPILKYKNELRVVGPSKFAKENAFGYYAAKPKYAVRKPICILEKSSFAHLGWGFIDYVYYKFVAKLANYRRNK